MSRRVALCSLLLAWLCANGAIWNVVQVLAWGKMFAGYAQTMSLTAAARETFDPNKPCELCVIVTKAQDAQNEAVPSSPAPAAERLQLACDTVASFVLPETREAWSSPRARLALRRMELVPVPPPRAA